MIRNVQSSNTEAICIKYNHYIRESVVTFEEKPISITEMQERIEMASEKLPWLVFEEKNCILGYAYASKWKGRPFQGNWMENGSLG